MPAPIFAAVGRGLASAGQAALRVGSAAARAAVSAARSGLSVAGNLASRGAASVAQGGKAMAAEFAPAAKAAVNAGKAAANVAMSGVRQVGAATSSGTSAVGQAGQQAASSVQNTANSAINSVKQSANSASQTIQNLVQQLSQAAQGSMGGGGGGGSATPSPGGNQPGGSGRSWPKGWQSWGAPAGGGGGGGGLSPPAGNSSGGQGGRGGGQNSFIGNQLRGIARQAVGTSIGTAVGQSLQVLRLAMRYSGPMGGINIAKDAAGKGIEVVSWLAKLPGRLKDFGEALVKSREHVAQYNGTLAAAMAKIEHERLARDIRLGAATAKSGAYQTGQQSRLENNMLPMQAIWSNLTNIVTGGIQQGANVILEKIGGALAATPGFSAAGKALEKMAKDDGAKGGPLNSFVNQLGSGQLSKRHLPPIDGTGPRLDPRNSPFRKITGE